MDWLDLLAVQGILKSVLQHHSSKASILLCSAFFIVQLSHPYMTTGKTITLTRWTFVSKVMALLFSMLSGLVITFLQKSKCLLISWLQSGCSNSFFFFITSLLRYYCTSLCVHVYSVTLVLSNSSTLWTVASHAPGSMGLSRQEHWSGLPCPPSRDLPNPGMEPVSPTAPPPPPSAPADSLLLSQLMDTVWWIWTFV